jgi:hypothetical protein
MKIILAGWLILTAVFGAAAQNACETLLPQAPAVLGLRLGMSPAEVQAVFGPDLRVKVKTSGTRSFFQNYIKEPARGSLAGVRALYLRFDEGRLYQAEVFYEEDFRFKTLAELTSDFAAVNNFPADLWQVKYGRAEIDCGRFSIRADRVLNPRLELTDEETLAKIAAARKK